MTTRGKPQTLLRLLLAIVMLITLTPVSWVYTGGSGAEAAVETTPEPQASLGAGQATPAPEPVSITHPRGETAVEPTKASEGEPAEEPDTEQIEETGEDPTEEPHTALTPEIESEAETDSEPADEPGVEITEEGGEEGGEVQPPLQYTLDFDSQGGTVVPSQAYTATEQLGDLPVPTREGYQFKGWFTAPSDGEEANAHSTLTALSIMETPLLYAHWSRDSSDRASALVTIHYINWMGATLRLTDTDTAEAGQPYTIAVPTITDYIFADWRLNNGGLIGNTTPTISSLPEEGATVILIYGHDPGNTGREYIKFTKTFETTLGDVIAPPEVVYVPVGNAFQDPHTPVAGYTYHQYRKDNGPPTAVGAEPYITTARGDVDTLIAYLYTHNGYPVTVEYVALDGTPLAGDTTDTVLPNNAFTIPIEAVPGYLPLYYKVNASSAEYDPVLTPEQIITEATIITVYYYSTLLALDVPVESMAFFARHTDGGAVMSPSYEIRNDSDLPVKATFKGMAETVHDTVVFVANAAAEREVHLNLVPSPVSGNGFTAGVNNINPGASYMSALGTLDGAYVGASGRRSGHLTITGHYQGSFPVTPYTPQVAFTLGFELQAP